MKEMIVFDGQLFQTGAWHRGMGKYCLQLISEHSRQSKHDEIYLLLNSNLPIANDMLDEIKSNVPRIKLLELELPVPDKYHSNQSEYQNVLDEKLSYLTDENKVIFIITSLFLFDYFACFPKKSKKGLIFYDLTPIICWDDLKQFFPAHLYMKRFEKVFESDIIFSISETIKSDVVNYFGIEKDRVININGGHTVFQLKSVKPKNIKLPKKYILFPTGDLPHKNNDFAIRGFEMADIDKDIKLVITSTFSNESKERLLKYSDRLIFSGNVSDEELNWLYENGQAILFASKYEGLGIPILDALSHKLPIIASAIPVFKEMSKNAFYFFDFSNEISLSNTIRNAINIIDFEKKVNNYNAILSNYSWENTTRLFIQGIDELKKQGDSLNNSNNLPKEKISIICANPALDGLSRWLDRINYKLSNNYEINYYFDSKGKSPDEIGMPSFLTYIANSHDISDFSKDKYYGKIVYILENDDLTYLSGVWSINLPGNILLFDHDYKDSQNKVINLLISLKIPITKINVNNCDDLFMLINRAIADYNESNLEKYLKKMTHFRDKIFLDKLKRRLLG